MLRNTKVSHKSSEILRRWVRLLAQVGFRVGDLRRKTGFCALQWRRSPYQNHTCAQKSMDLRRENRWTCAEGNLFLGQHDLGCVCLVDGADEGAESVVAVGRFPEGTGAEILEDGNHKEMRVGLSFVYQICQPPLLVTK